MPEYTSNSKEDTVKIAKQIAVELSSFKKGHAILLYGDLGIGKTEFSRGFIQHLCGENVNVASPTFNLAQIYGTELDMEIWHFDLYRLKHESELHEIGFFEAVENSIVLIEWPEIAEKYFTKNYSRIKLSRDSLMSETRVISVEMV